MQKRKRYPKLLFCLLKSIWFSIASGSLYALDKLRISNSVIVSNAAKIHWIYAETTAVWALLYASILYTLTYERKKTAPIQLSYITEFNGFVLRTELEQSSKWIHLSCTEILSNKTTALKNTHTQFCFELRIQILILVLPYFNYLKTYLYLSTPIPHIRTF